MSQTAIPSVDLMKFTAGTTAEREEFVRSIGKAYEEIGFVTVINHGIDYQLVNDFYDVIKAFFALPVETKLKYEIFELAGQRGYTSFGREKAKGFQAADLKEFWQIGQTVSGNDPIGKEYPENVFVEELPRFMEIGNALYKSFERSGREILSSLSLFLGLGADYFDAKIHNGNSILRALHYPPITSEPKSAIRAEQHEDINLITLLVGASAEGLQVLPKSGDWLSVTAPEGSIIVNVGDMLQRLTNNRLRSTTHRVVNPPRELWHTSRYSIPFFLHPRSEMDLTCLSSCVTAENPLQYESITAGDYLNERLVEIGLKK